MKLFSVIYASCRASEIKKHVAQWIYKTENLNDIEFILVVDEVNPECVQEALSLASGSYHEVKVKIIPAPSKGSNLAFNEGAKLATGKILMGYKGDTYMDSGFFYMPYVPLMQTPVVLDPESFCMRRGMLTRYASKMLATGPRFYATIQINNFSI